MTAYPAHVLEHYRAPRNRRAVPDATHGHSVSNPLCGDEVTVRLRVEGGTVVDAGWEGVGCAVAVAAASLLTEHVRDRVAGEVAALTLDGALALVGAPLNQARTRCASLAWEAVRGALASGAADK